MPDVSINWMENVYMIHPWMQVAYSTVTTSVVNPRRLLAFHRFQILSLPFYLLKQTKDISCFVCYLNTVPILCYFSECKGQMPYFLYL